MQSLRNLLLCGWVGVFGFATATPAQEKKPAEKGIEPAIVAAYEKIGAKYGGLVKGEFDVAPSFQEGRAAAEKGLPGFFFKSGPKSKLPAVTVPFCLHFLAITDAELKELADVKNLSWLSLAFTEVTDAGLKDLAGLKNLSTLYLMFTKVTDAGVKEFNKALPKCQVAR